MKSVFFKVWTAEGDREITDLISSFRYEDCLYEDDLLQLEIKTKNPNLIDEDFMITGKQLKYQFGYIQGSTSAVRIARITDIEATYSGVISISIKCLDKGTVMKKDAPKKVWKGLTASQIAESIAKTHGLETNIETTTKKYDNIAQGKKTDFSFLKQLAAMESEGTFIFFVKNNTLNFIKRNLNQNSTRTFVYGDPDGGVISFSVKLSESEADSNADSVKTTVVNPKNNGLITETSESEKALGDNKLWKFSSETGERIKDVILPANNHNLKKGTGKGVASSMNNKATLKTLTADLEIEGDPLITANGVITMAGVAKKHGGNWYVAKVTHQVGQGSYKTSIELSKNAVKKPATEGSSLTSGNNSVGSNKENKTTPLIRKYLSEDGTQIKTK